MGRDITVAAARLGRRLTPVENTRRTMWEFLSEHLTIENGVFLLESLFWPALWTVTYCCALGLLVSTVQGLYRRAAYRTAPAMASAPSSGNNGVYLMVAGVVGVIACSIVWEVLFGDLSRAGTLLVASHLHGTQDYREMILLILSTLSVVAADIGSLIFLDQLPPR
jgi:hypothetical protein